MSFITIIPADELGRRLKVLRKAKGLAQVDVAKRMGLSIKTLSDLENGHRFTTKQMDDYATVLDINIRVSIELGKEDIKRLFIEEARQESKQKKI